MTSQALQLAVQRAYEVFGGNAAPREPLDVCTYCCMPEELEREMRSLPLRQLTPHHFYEYCTGAKSCSIQPAGEIKYLLPRWMELFSNGDQLHHSIEIVFDRVGRCAPNALTHEEKAVLDAFMLACFDSCLNGEFVRKPIWYEFDNPLSLLIMADYAGVELAPLLQHWMCHAGQGAIIRFVDSTYWDFWPTQSITNAFANDRPYLQSVFKDWIQAPETKAAFIAKLLQPDFLALVDRNRSKDKMPFSLKVDAVFEHLSH